MSAPPESQRTASIKTTNQMRQPKYPVIQFPNLVAGAPVGFATICNTYRPAGWDLARNCRQTRFLQFANMKIHSNFRKNSGMIRIPSLAPFSLPITYKNEAESYIG